MRGMYTPAERAEICDKIADRLVGGESMRQICEDDDMPDRATVLRWMANDDQLAARCARARDMQADATVDDMRDIELRVADGTMDPKAGRTVLSSMQWRAVKLAPKKYGDKSSLELTGKNGGPVQLSDTERAAKLKALLAVAQTRREAGDEDVSDLL